MSDRKEPIRLAVAGAAGRMGSAVLGLADADPGFLPVAALTAPDCPHLGTMLELGAGRLEVASRLETPCDVLIDFTDGRGTEPWIHVCTAADIPIVIGSTGHDDATQSLMLKAACWIPVFVAPNFSLGVNVLLEMIGSLAARLGDDYDIEVVETHHRGKIDAPSGTAQALVDRLRDGRDQDRPAGVVHGRHGNVGSRPRGQIGVHAIRMGDVIGRHEVHFSGAGETLTLGHTAHSRDAFAAGALRAAAWVVGKEAGRYGMADLLAGPPSI